MNNIAIAIAVSLLAGLAVGAWFSGEDPVDDRLSGSAVLPEDGSAEERLARLEQIVIEERDARIALEDTLAMLFDELERLEGASDRVDVERQAEAEREREARALERRASFGSPDWLARYQERRVGRMVEGGFSEDEARRILQQESEAEYKAMLAAWEVQRSRETIDRFSSTTSTQGLLRSEIGDDAYARYLEVQGQPTSINVTQVLSGSPGSTAGLQAGDQLVSYGGERVFSIVDIRNQTMQGEPGEEVVIEIERDGMRMQLTVPRGPIGITGNGANVRGSRWWGG